MPRKKSGNFDQQKYENDFHRENYKRFNVRYRYGTDQDVIDKLASTSYTDYIRSLVRADIAQTPALIASLEAAITELQREKEHASDPDAENAFAISINSIIHSVESTTTLQYDWKMCKFKS